jgi:hypothetical protein
MREPTRILPAPAEAGASAARRSYKKEAPATAAAELLRNVRRRIVMSVSPVWGFGVEHIPMIPPAIHVDNEIRAQKPDVNVRFLRQQRLISGPVRSNERF